MWLLCNRSSTTVTLEMLEWINAPVSLEVSMTLVPLAIFHQLFQNPSPSTP
jgi:hypothetical protein